MNKAPMRKGKKENFFIEHFEKEREEVLGKDGQGPYRWKRPHREQLIELNAANGQGC